MLDYNAKMGVDWRVLTLTLSVHFGHFGLVFGFGKGLVGSVLASIQFRCRVGFLVSFSVLCGCSELCVLVHHRIENETSRQTKHTSKIINIYGLR